MTVCSTIRSYNYHLGDPGTNITDVPAQLEYYVPGRRNLKINKVQIQTKYIYGFS